MQFSVFVFFSVLYFFCICMSVCLIVFWILWSDSNKRTYVAYVFY